MNIMIARNLLEHKGIKVTVAENGQAALELFKKSFVGQYQAILMDIRMPIMDGLTSAKAIRGLERQDAKRIPIIAMTANALDENRRNSMAAGMNAHLAKPFNPDQLYEVLARCIKESEE